MLRLGGPTLPYDRTYHLLHRVDKIRQWVRHEQPDVLEAHSPYLATAAVLACGRRSARVQTAFWHSDHVGVHVEPALERCVGEPASRAIGSTLRRGLGALLAPYDATFVAGRFQAAQLRRAGVRRVVHVPFGVDKQTFRPSARDPRWRDQWEGSNGAAVLVGVGRFAGEKRWDVVLKAFTRLRSRRHAILVLYGDGPERAKLQREAPHGVHFAGFESDRGRLASALASADLLLHGSPCETYGLSIAEAVACGLPIVVPAAGAAEEHAHPDCSATYPSLDVAACEAAVERLLRRDPHELRQRALEAVATVPPMEDHFRQVLDVYADLFRELRR